MKDTTSSGIVLVEFLFNKIFHKQNKQLTNFPQKHTEIERI